MNPDCEDNPDYTSVVNDRHFDRLRGYLDDARRRGSEVIELGAFDGPSATHKMAPALVLEPPDEAAVMQQEIFGPLLPIRSSDPVAEAIDEVNPRARPLALYYFGRDTDGPLRVPRRTTFGGVTADDLLTHVAQAVFTEARFDVGAMLRPPYGKRMMALVERMIRR